MEEWIVMGVVIVILCVLYPPFLGFVFVVGRFMLMASAFYAILRSFQS
jgi:hypothetical protein